MSRTPGERDPQGKVALFSGARRSDGPVAIDCSACGVETRVGIVHLARLATPSFTIPLKYHHTWMLCPACSRRTWVRLRKVD